MPAAGYTQYKVNIIDSPPASGSYLYKRLKSRRTGQVFIVQKGVINKRLTYEVIGRDTCLQGFKTFNEALRFANEYL